MKIKKALVISFSGIGDALLSEVLCENLKSMFPDIQVDLVVKDNSAPLFLTAWERYRHELLASSQDIFLIIVFILIFLFA